VWGAVFKPTTHPFSITTLRSTLRPQRRGCRTRSDGAVEPTV